MILIDHAIIEHRKEDNKETIKADRTQHNGRQPYVHPHIHARAWMISSPRRRKAIQKCASAGIENRDTKSAIPHSRSQYFSDTLLAGEEDANDLALQDRLDMCRINSRRFEY